MPEHIHYDDEDLWNRETHHEETDVPVRPLFVFIGIVIVFAIVTHLVLWFMYKGLAKAERGRTTAPMTNVAKPESERVPNQPLLQPFPRQAGDEIVPPQRNTPVTDMADMLRAQNEQLASYGWVDRDKGVVRIPIELAKDLVVQRGLPTQAAPAVVPSIPTAAPPGGTANAPKTPPVPATEGDSNPAAITATTGTSGAH